MVLVPIALYFTWELLAPYITIDVENPFAPLLFVSHRVPSSSHDDPRYQKGYLDLVFLAYYVVVWSFVRQFITLYACLPLARWGGIRRRSKLDRFGEQGYSLIYFGFMGLWGLVCMSSLYLGVL
jgi:very-long-chain ceramide synthase